MLIIIGNSQDGLPEDILITLFIDPRCYDQALDSPSCDEHATLGSMLSDLCVTRHAFDQNYYISHSLGFGFPFISTRSFDEISIKMAFFCLLAHGGQTTVDRSGGLKQTIASHSTLDLSRRHHLKNLVWMGIYLKNIFFVLNLLIIACVLVCKAVLPKNIPLFY
jgi:hypothetical protein